MLLRELLASAGYVYPKTLENIEISGIECDSRRVARGNVFVALAGLREDGFSHIGEAIARGAALIVAEREAKGAPSFAVRDARAATARLYDAWYGHPAKSLSLIGVTGTNGKTSVSTMIAAVLRRAGVSCGLIGTVECSLDGEKISAPNADRLANMTTPDPAQLYAVLAEMRDKGARYVVMEVSSHALTFRKTDPLFFERAVFTNLSPDHLDLHGDMEAYFAEKRKLFSACAGAVVNCFSPYGQRLADGLHVPLWRLDAQTLRKARTDGCRGVSFSIFENGRENPFTLPLVGNFFVENGALAALTALSVGVPYAVAADALSTFSGVRGRMERVSDETDDITVFIDYAHTPDALEKLLYSVRDIRESGAKIHLLFGCGGDRDRTKRAVMGRVGSRLADFLILTADNSRSEKTADILRDILRGVDREKPHTVIENRKDAIAFALQNAKSGDIVLLAGKGHEEYEIIGQERLPFSERDVVREELLRRKKGGGK